MSKEVFLGELKSHLEVLEDQEQQDILQEYAQHIDIKIQNGQSEEDAIRDFGPVNELAAEILEAYHVKPGFGSRNKKKLPDIGGVFVLDGEAVVQKAGGFLKRTFGKLGSGIKGSFGKLMGMLKNLAGRIKGVFGGKGRFGEEQDRRGRQMEDLRIEGRDTEHLEGEGQRMERRSFGGQSTAFGNQREAASFGEGAVLKALRKGAKSFFGAVLSFVRWCFRTAGKLLLWTVAAGAGIGALVSLFGFGAVLILACQGYPLKGMTIGFLGMLSGSGAVFALCVLFKNWRKQLLAGFCASVLVCGLGVGITFVEFSSLSYAGQEVIGEVRMKTEELEAQIDPELGVWQLSGISSEERASLVLDESVPENTVRLQITYNEASMTPEFYSEVYYDTWYDEEGGQKERPVPTLELYGYMGSQDEVELFMEAKDLFLKGLKEGKITSFRPQVSVEKVTLLINPANEGAVRV